MGSILMACCTLGVIYVPKVSCTKDLEVVTPFLIVMDICHIYGCTFGYTPGSKRHESSYTAKKGTAKEDSQPNVL